LFIDKLIIDYFKAGEMEVRNPLFEDETTPKAKK